VRAYVSFAFQDVPPAKILAFSRDSQLAWGSFAIAPTSELVAVWDARPTAWRERACAVANRQLSAQEWDRFVGAGMPHEPLCRTA
jgi:hypothetical protein